MKHWKSPDAARLMEEELASDPRQAVYSRIHRFLKQHGIDNFPVNLDVLGSYRGISQIRPAKLSQAGLIRRMTSGKGFEILYHEDDVWAKQQFSIAHEIAHTFMPSWGDDSSHNLLENEPRSFLDWGKLSQTQEVEFLCDAGAAYLLCPDWYIRKIIPQPSVTIQNIQILSLSTHASLETIAIQLTNVALFDAKCVVVFEPGLKQAEKAQLLNAVLPTFEHIGPTKKWRISKVFPTPAFRDTGIFLPRNKSIQNEHELKNIKTDGLWSGKLTFVVGKKTLEFCSECKYAPYQGNDRLLAVLSSSDI